MKKIFAVLGVLVLSVLLGLAIANFTLAGDYATIEPEQVLPTRVVGVMVWDASKTTYRTENVQFSSDGPPTLLICEMPGSTAKQPVYAIQPWQPLLSPRRHEDYTSGSP
jgi:hypothetical protein